MSEGYERLVQNYPLPHSTSLWKNIWHSDSLPKVNFFCWLLVQGKIVMINNLEKINIQGPSWCVLCHDLVEYIEHIFCSCPFTREVWWHAFELVGHNTNLPSNWEEMF